MAVTKKTVKIKPRTEDSKELIARWLKETFEPGMLIRFHDISIAGMSDTIKDFYRGLVGKTARIDHVARTHLAFKIEDDMRIPNMGTDECFFVYPDMDKFEIVKEDNE
jgi:hypothetical protein